MIIFKEKFWRILILEKRSLNLLHSPICLNRERLSLRYSYILHHTLRQRITHLVQVDLRILVRQKLVIWIYKVLNMDIFLTKMHHFTSEGLY